MMPPEWEGAVSRVLTHLESMDVGARSCLLAVACEHLLPFAVHAEIQGLGVEADVLRSAVDALWDRARGRTSSVAVPDDLLEAQIPTDWAGVGRSGHGAEQVAGLVRCLAVTREFEADPSSAIALDGLVGVADSLSDFGDLPEDELAELERVGAQFAAASWPPSELGSLRKSAYSHGQAILERAAAMDLWDDEGSDGLP